MLENTGLESPKEHDGSGGNMAEGKQLMAFDEISKEYRYFARRLAATRPRDQVMEQASLEEWLAPLARSERLDRSVGDNEHWIWLESPRTPDSELEPTETQLRVMGEVLERGLSGPCGAFRWAEVTQWFRWGWLRLQVSDEGTVGGLILHAGREFWRFPPWEEVSEAQAGIIATVAKYRVRPVLSPFAQWEV